MGTAQSYLLWALYSYLFRETAYTNILYIWASDSPTPLSSSSLWSEFILGKKIDYDSNLLPKDLGISYELQDDFGKGNAIWAQHLYYQSIGSSMKVLPLSFPLQRWEDPSHVLVFDQLLTSIREKQDTACIIIDDFEIQHDEDGRTTIVSESSSLSTLYNKFSQKIGQEVSVLMDQPSYHAVEADCSWAVVWLG